MQDSIAKDQSNIEEVENVTRLNEAMNDYKKATIESLMRNEIYNTDELVELLNHEKLQASALNNVIATLGGAKIGQIDNIEKILKNLWNHKNRNDTVIQGIIYFLSTYQYDVATADNIIQKILKLYPIESNYINENLYEMAAYLSRRNLSIDHSVIKRLIVDLSKIKTGTYNLSSLFTGIRNYQGKIGKGVNSIELAQRVIGFFDKDFSPYQYAAYLEAFYYSQIAMNDYSISGLNQIDMILNKFKEHKKNVEDFVYSELFSTGACFLRDINDYKILKSKLSNLTDFKESNLSFILEGLAECNYFNKDIKEIILLEMNSSDSDVITEIYSIIRKIDNPSNEIQSFLIESFLKYKTNEDIYISFVALFPEYLKKLNDDGRFNILDELNKKSGYDLAFLYLAALEISNEENIPFEISRKAIKETMGFFNDVFISSIYDLTVFEKDFILILEQKMVTLKKSKVITKNQVNKLNQHLKKLEKAKLYF